MKVARLFGFVFTAVCALAALVASSAFASDPEFTHLPLGTHFTSHSGTSILRSVTATIICTSDQNSGEITSMDSVGKVTVHFLGCKEHTTGGECPLSSSGFRNSAELILTNTLRGLLGLVHTNEEATSLVGILFEPETGEDFTLFNATEAPCSTAETAVKGNVAGEVTPINRLVPTSSINLFASAASPNKKNRIQEILVLSGAVKPKLIAFGAVEATEETFDEVLWDGEVEVD
jgi:hypothetical protein